MNYANLEAQFLNDHKLNIAIERASKEIFKDEVRSENNRAAKQAVEAWHHTTTSRIRQAENI